MTQCTRYGLCLAWINSEVSTSSKGEKRLKKKKMKYFWSWYLWLYPTTDFLQADKELANPTATQQGFAQKISKKTYQISKKKTEISWD